MTSRKTIITRQLLSATIAALISASAAATPFDPSQPVGPVMKGLVQAIDTATKSRPPLSAALVDTSDLPGALYNPPENSRRFSSIWSNQGPAGVHAKSQLNSTQAWSAAFNNDKQWIELPILSGSKAIGIATQGRSDANQWVKRYKVSAVLPDGSLVPLHGQKALNGNSNRNELVTHTFSAPQQATAIRITPTAWHYHISLRAALLTEAESCSVQNLITNGSFEEHGPLNRNGWGTFAQIPGWTASTGHIELQKNNVGGISAAEGQSKLELDAHHNSTVYTDVATNTGQNYQLAFAYSPRDTRTDTDTNDVEVWWDGQKVKTLSGHQRQWQSVELQLRANSQSTRLEFRGAGTSDSVGGYIDSVTLKPDDNLLSNGSFESHAPINNGSWSTFDAIPGWQATVGQIELQLGRTGGIHALDGNAKLELDAHRNSAVITTLNTEANARYTVSFAYSPRVNSHGTSTNNAEVWWNNTKIATLKGSKPTWRNYAIPVTAANAQSQLTFKATGHSDGLGALIDKVAVRPTSNHIVNGSFEQHGAFNQQNWGTFAQIPGWSSDTGDIEIQRGNTSGIRALAGRDKLELDAHGNSSISTQINTTAGKHYQLRLAYSPRVTTAGTDSNDVEIRWHGQLIDTLSRDTQGWSIHTYSVTATAAQSELSLTASGSNDSLGGLIDGVSLLAEGCDTTQPNTLAAVFDTPTEGQQLKQSTPTVVIDITGTDNPSTQVDLSIDGQSTTVSCVADQLVTARLHCDTPNPLTDGDHSMSATVSDTAGATGTTSTVNFAIDTVPPVIHWDQPLDGAYLNDQPIVVAGTLMPAQDSLTLNGDPLTLDTQGNFDTSLTLPEGTHTLVLSAQDPADNTQTLTRTIIIDRSAPSLPATSLINFDEAPEGKVQITGSAGSVEANTWVEITNTRTGEVMRVQADANGAFTAALTGLLGDQFTLTASDAANNNSPVLKHTYSGNLPPDPATVAPPLPTTGITPPWEQWNFLHTGSNPIQREVAPDTFVDEHVALLRGKVLDMAGEPLPGARITIKDHPEYGYTLSRLDGMWDMLINGGGANVVDYTLDGYLHLQRRLDPNWLETQYAEDVVMTPLDDQVTAIDTSDLSKPFHVATGAHVTDRFGERKLHMLFPAGTQAHYKRADGTQVDLDQFHVRATEYTVGDLGPNAMPGELPPASMYTYAMELTLDESLDAVQTDGKDVWFDNDVTVYLDNFMDVPTGTLVPVGYYNPSAASWRGEIDGIVVKFVEANAGVAVVSINEDDSPATSTQLNNHNITTEELREIASIYSTGDSFWRVRTSHFSIFDYNFLINILSENFPPNSKVVNNQQSTSNGGCDLAGCEIDPTQQILKENLPLTNTASSLKYSSVNSKTLMAENGSVTINITDGDPPGADVLVKAILSVGGQRYVKQWTDLINRPNLEYTFNWNGKDGYDRDLVGYWDANIRLEYHYIPKPRLSSGSNSSGSQSWAATAATEGNNGSIGNGLRGDLATLILAREWDTKLSAPISPLTESAAVGGWSLSNQHFYIANSGTVLLGTGETHETTNLVQNRVKSKLTEDMLYSADGSTAGQSFGNMFFHTQNILPQADGSHILSSSNSVYKIENDGAVTLLAGKAVNVTDNSFPVDGTQATEAYLRSVKKVAQTEDGSLYVSAFDGLVRVNPDGEIKRLWYSNSSFNLNKAWNINKSSDNNVIGCDAIQIDGTRGLYRINQSDEWEEIARSVEPFSENPYYYPAVKYNDAGNQVASCDFSSNNELQIFHGSGNTNGYNGQGIISTVNLTTGAISREYGLGTVPVQDWYDGMDAHEASTHPSFVIPDGNGGMYWSVRPAYEVVGNAVGKSEVWHVSDESKLTHIAGNWQSTSADAYEAQDGKNARKASISAGLLTLNSSGNLLIVDVHADTLYEIQPAHPGLSNDIAVVPSPDGNKLWHFAADGRHLKTTDTTTGTVLFSFAYNSNNRLLSFADRDGNITAINRDPNGLATAITSPYGQMTELTINTEKMLTGLSNTENQEWFMTYSSGGLLTTFKRPSGDSNTFDYEATGRLKQDRDSSQGGWDLARTETESGHQISITSALGRTSTYELSLGDNGQSTYEIHAADGSKTQYSYTTDGGNSFVSAAGTQTTRTATQDSQLGALAPQLSATSTLPSGLTHNTKNRRTVDGLQQLIPTTITETRDINNRVFKREFDATTNTWTNTSAERRISTATVDALGRLASTQPAGISAISLQYRSDGLLEKVTHGDELLSRTSTYNYFADGPAKGTLESITDPLNRTVSFKRDAIGRATEQTLPDGRTVGFSFDDNGNLETLTPPGRSAHVFHYDDRDLRQQDQPPALASGHTLTQYSYNLDKQLTQVLRPDSQIIQLNYGAATGLLNDMQTPRGGFVYNYNPTTAQVSSVSTPEGETLNYRYDGELPIGESWAGEITGDVDFQLNNDLVPDSITVNNSAAISYSYDKDLLLSNAGDLTITRGHAAGLITGTSLEGRRTSQSYNDFGELETLSATVAGFDNTYTRDKLGRITTRTESIDGVTVVYGYSYDLSGRLESVTKDGTETESYTYDSNSNRLTATVNGVTTTAIVDAQDRLLTYGSTGYDYTLNGELKSKTTGGVSTTFDYDVFGNLLSATLPGDLNIGYVVDAQHRRIGKRVNGILKQGFLYQDQLNPIAELDGDNNVVSRFVYGTRPNVPDYLIKDGKNYRIIADHLGSPRLIVDVETGAVIQRMNFDTFGNVINDTNPGFQPFGFAGGIYDHHTELTRFGTRDYDASTGRWTAKDPIGFAGGDVNLYGYVGVDPVNFVDMRGTDTVSAGVTVRAPAWLAKWIAGRDDVGNGVFAGIAFSYPGFSGGCWDAGLYAGGNLSGVDVGTGKFATEIAYSQGSVSDLAGKGIEAHAHGIRGLGVGASYDANTRELTGISLSLGRGINAGYSGTLTSTLSIRDNYTSYR